MLRGVKGLTGEEWWGEKEWLRVVWRLMFGWGGKWRGGVAERSGRGLWWKGRIAERKVAECSVAGGRYRKE